jgi:hypothetical protein
VDYNRRWPRQRPGHFASRNRVNYSVREAQRVFGGVLVCLVNSHYGLAGTGYNVITRTSGGDFDMIIAMMIRH